MVSNICFTTLFAAAAVFLAGCGSMSGEPSAPPESSEVVQAPSLAPASPEGTYEPTAPVDTPETAPTKYEYLSKEVRILQDIVLYDENTNSECLLLARGKLKFLEYPAVGGFHSHMMGYNVRSVYVDRNQELDVVGAQPECAHGRELFISDHQWVGEGGQLEKVAEAA